MLEIRKATAFVKDLESKEKDNTVSETLEVIDTIKDKELIKLLYQSNGFDYKGKLHQIYYRGYDLQKECLFILFGEKVLAE